MSTNAQTIGEVRAKLDREMDLLRSELASALGKLIHDVPSSRYLVAVIMAIATFKTWMSEGKR